MGEYAYIGNNDTQKVTSGNTQSEYISDINGPAYGDRYGNSGHLGSSQEVQPWEQVLNRANGLFTQAQDAEYDRLRKEAETELANVRNGQWASEEEKKKYALGGGAFGGKAPDQNIQKWWDEKWAPKIKGKEQEITGYKQGMTENAGVSRESQDLDYLKSRIEGTAGGGGGGGESSKAPTYSAPTFTAPEMLGAKAADPAALAQQEAWAKTLQSRAMGEGPSIAEMQAKSSMDEASQRAMSMAASARGGNVAAAMRAAQQQQGLNSQAAARQAAITRAQEMQQAGQLYAGQLGQITDTQKAMGLANASMSIDTQKANLDAAIRTNAANADSTLRTNTLNSENLYKGNEKDLAYLKIYFDTVDRDRTFKLEHDKLVQSGQLGESQINAGTANANAGNATDIKKKEMDQNYGDKNFIRDNAVDLAKGAASGGVSYIGKAAGSAGGGAGSAGGGGTGVPKPPVPGAGGRA